MRIDQTVKNYLFPLEYPIAFYLVLTTALVASETAFSQNFTIANGVIETTQQTLNTNGSTGTIDAGGQLNTTPTAINSTGDDITVNNGGSITTTGSNAFGIRTTGTGAAINNTGNIGTTGNGSDGVRSDGANATILNSGAITTTGNGARGIETRGANTMINNSGNINTTGTTSHGIESFGVDAAIVNSGNINTTANNSRGIRSNGAATGAMITNNGSILTSGTNADGIEAFGDNSTINNSGAINTSGRNARAIEAFGDNANISNTGTLNTSGRNGHGVRVAGGASNATVSNTGAINTTDRGARGIEMLGDDATITNDGSISTTGVNSAAIRVAGGAANANVANNGMINTTGNNARGLEILGANAIIANDGSITTSGRNAHGIRANGANANVTNDGTINTSGQNAHGILASQANATLTNTGSIAVTGPTSVGVRITRDGTTLNNNGLISASGNATQAILGGGGQQVVNLGPNSQIIGTFNLGGGNNDTVNILAGAGASVALTFTNTEIINIDPNAFATQPTVSTAIKVDTTGASVQGETINSFTTSIHRSISKRFSDQSFVDDGIVVSTKGFRSANPKLAWGSAFGKSRERSEDGSTLAYSHTYTGLLGGFEQDYSIGRLGFVAGYANGRVETNIQSVDTDIDSYFGGMYLYVPAGRTNLTFSMLAGYESYDNDRYVIDNLNGIQVANADFSNTFISASATASRAMKIAEFFELRPSITATYTAAFFDNYAETGTTSANLIVDSRTVQAINTRAQLATAYIKDNVETEVRFGVDGYFSDEDVVSTSLAGTNFQFGTTDSNKIIAGYVGAKITLLKSNNLKLVADAEYQYANDQERAFAAYLNVNYKF